MIASERTTADSVNRKLVDQYTEISRLAGALAHEIKNPLSTIRLNMELLAEDFSKAQTPRDRRALAKVQVVHRECDRLQALLDDFLNYAKAQSRPKLEPSNLNHLLCEVLDFFGPKARDAGIEVIDYLDPDLPSVLLDREALHRALLNLILNAEQAMPKGGQLVIRTHSAGNWVVLDLIDTGSGMDAKTQEQIFEAFFSTKPGGSGLGLPTAKKIIEGHGGQVSLQSEIGRGTQFTIKLPVLPRLAADRGP